MSVNVTNYWKRCRSKALLSSRSRQAWEKGDMAIKMLTQSRYSRLPFTAMGTFANASSPTAGSTGW